MEETIRETLLPKNKPAVANLGIKMFYDSMVAQGARCVQIEWTPPVRQSEEIAQLLDEFL